MKKKIVISIDWFLPGTKSGGPVRSYANLIDHFKDEFEFYIITRNTDYCELIPYQNIESNTWITKELNVYVYYFSQSELSKKNLKKVYNSISFDIILINGLYSWYFSILPLLILKSSSFKKIVSARGMLNSQAFSVKKKKKKIFIGIASLLGFYKNVVFHATNILESQSIKKEIGKTTKVLIASNLPRVMQTQVKNYIREKESKKVKFITVARIAKEKGALYTLQALVLINKLDVVIELDFYGALYDTEYWKECERLILKLPKNIIVNYKGNINGNQLFSTLQQYHFLILPSEGENYGHAILESLSAGLPVIISNNTPWTNLESKKIGWDVDIRKIENLRIAIEKSIDMNADVYQQYALNAVSFANTIIYDKKVKQSNRLLLNL